MVTSWRPGKAPVQGHNFCRSQPLTLPGAVYTPSDCARLPTQRYPHILPLPVQRDAVQKGKKPSLQMWTKSTAKKKMATQQQHIYNTQLSHFYPYGHCHRPFFPWQCQGLCRWWWHFWEGDCHNHNSWISHTHQFKNIMSKRLLAQRPFLFKKE